MSISYQDSDKYKRAIADLAHLIQVFGSREILLDLQYFFPDQYEDMLKALDLGVKTKKLARLLDASESRCGRVRVAYSGVVIEGPDSSGGDK